MPSISNRPKPNILFFFTDDQRFNTIHALGNTEIDTPNLDYLVREGTAFSNAYIMGGSVPAVCMPSRAMLMTGRTLFHIEGAGETVAPDQIMMPEYLKANGYDTFGTGKWHNGTAAYTRCFSDGGEIMFGGMNDHWNVPACDFSPGGNYSEPETIACKMYQDLPPQNTRCIYDHIEKGKHSSELFCDEAIRFLEGRKGEKPFFLYVSFMAPHDPRTMPQEFLNLYDPDDIQMPRNFMPEHPFDNGELNVRDEMLAPWPRTSKVIGRHIAAYYAMISHLDAEIGRVLDMLKAAGEVDNTVIIFAGDNGLALGQHGLMGKQSNYDHSVHVPLIMKGPGIPRGKTREAYCQLNDIFPTVCDFTGLPVPDSVEGRSLVKNIADPEVPGRGHLLYAYRNIHRAVLEDGFKLIEYFVEGKRTSQLFNLAEDPWETRNLIDRPEYRDRIPRLRKLLRLWRDELDDPAEEFWKET